MATNRVYPTSRVDLNRPFSFSLDWHQSEPSCIASSRSFSLIDWSNACEPSNQAATLLQTGQLLRFHQSFRSLQKQSPIDDHTVRECTHLLTHFNVRPYDRSIFSERRRLSGAKSIFAPSLTVMQLRNETGFRFDHNLKGSLHGSALPLCKKKILKVIFQLTSPTRWYPSRSIAVRPPVLMLGRFLMTDKPELVSKVEWLYLLLSNILRWWQKTWDTKLMSNYSLGTIFNHQNNRAEKIIWFDNIECVAWVAICQWSKVSKNTQHSSRSATGLSLVSSATRLPI